MHLAQEVAFGIRLWKDVGGAEADGVLFGVIAGVAGHSKQNRRLLQMLALTDRVNEVARICFRDDRRDYDELWVCIVERANRFVAVVGERRLDRLTSQGLLDAVGVPRLVLDNENVFRHVR